MSAYMGKHQKPFVDTYADLTRSIQLKLMEYLKPLLDPLQNTSSTPSQNMAQPPVILLGNILGMLTNSKLSIERQDGFPVMPDVNDKALKENLEDLVRRYLTAHYSKSCPVGVRHKVGVIQL